VVVVHSLGAQMSIPRNAIVDLLGPNDKATVLMAAGLPAGRAADIASRVRQIFGPRWRNRARSDEQTQ
jgi:hypothetical protein